MEEEITPTDIEELENFLLDNPEFDRLESLLQKFNIFETLKIVETEVRHSYVLAWLLDPSENHGIGSYFLKQFLKYYFIENRNSVQESIGLFDFERLSLSDVEIRREWKHIDILIVIAEPLVRGKIVVAIENKIRSLEHDNQLVRYRETLEQEFPDYIRLFIYLTPDNNLPRGDESWNLLGYSTIATLIESVLENKRDIINPGVTDFIKQYLNILRRYIVGNSEIEQICTDIYKKHKKALDLIFGYRPDIDLQISEHLQKELGKNIKFTVDAAGKTVIRFTTPLLDELIERVGEGWSKNNRILLFQFDNYNSRLVLGLYIGPGPQEYRNKLFAICEKEPNLFKLVNRKHGMKWHAVYQKKFLEKKDYEEFTTENSVDSVDLFEKVSKKWKDFIESDLLKIEEHFKDNRV